MAKRTALFVLLATTLLFANAFLITSCGNTMSDAEMREENQRLIEEADQLEVEPDDKE